MWDHQCGFRRNSSTTDLIFCVSKILEKKWEYNEAVHQFFVDFKKAYHSFRRKDLYNNLFEFGIPMKLATLIRMRLNEAFGRVCVDKRLSDMFPIGNGLTQGGVSSPLLFNVALDSAIMRVQANQDDLKLSGTHHILVYADNANILGGSVVL
jgi:hypothetical protein